MIVAFVLSVVGVWIGAANGMTITTTPPTLNDPKRPVRSLHGELIGEGENGVARRDEGGGNSGISGGAIGGIVAGVMIVLLAVCLFWYRSRRGTSFSSRGGPPPYPMMSGKPAPGPYPEPTYLPRYNGPRYTSHHYPSSQPTMPAAVHLGHHGGSYYPSAAATGPAQPGKGVRFGNVGVARYT